MPAAFAPLAALSLRELRVIAQTLTQTVPRLPLEAHTVTVRQVRMHPAAGFVDGVHHIHSCYEAILVLQGEVQYTDAVKTVSLREGDFQLYAPQTPHAWATGATSCLRLVLWFDVTPYIPLAVQAAPAHWPELLADTALLVNEVRQGWPGWQTRVTARLTALLSRSLCLADWPRSASVPLVQETAGLASIDQFLRDNLHRPLTLAQIAAHAGMSERSLTRHFRRANGASVRQYLFILRMDLAAQLLANPAQKIADIAAQVGIPDPAYFCACFRRHFHRTPGEYQQVLRTLQAQVDVSGDT